MRKTHSIVRLQSHANRTPTGRASATGARRLARYLAYGRGRLADQAQRPQRGVWYAETGQVRAHQDVLRWVEQQGKRLPYTHQLILSVPEGPLPAAAYGQAMRAGGDLFPEWRLIVHQDARHAHAHVIAFGQEEIRITGETFRQWWLSARQELENRQQEQLAERQSLTAQIDARWQKQAALRQSQQLDMEL